MYMSTTTLVPWFSLSQNLHFYVLLADVTAAVTQMTIGVTRR